jgi:hypothetical protein
LRVAVRLVAQGYKRGDQRKTRNQNGNAHPPNPSAACVMASKFAQQASAEFRRR